MNQNKTNKIDSNSKPSTQPLKSPLPDFTNANHLMPTYSPTKQHLGRQIHMSLNTKPIIRNNIHHQNRNHNNLYQISHQRSLNKNITPSTIVSKNNKMYVQQTYTHNNQLTNNRQRIITQVNYQINQHSKYHSAPITHFNCSCQEIHDKQQLINQLRKILVMISDSQFVSQFNPDQNISENHLRKQIQNLRIKNQALQKIVHQQRSYNNGIVNNDFLKKINFLQLQNHNLKNHINKMRADFEMQTNSLIQSNQSLTIKLKSLDEAGKCLAEQNQRLLSLLKNKDNSQRKLYQDYQDLKQSILLKTHEMNNQEQIVNSSNISMNSQTQRQKRIAIIKQRYNNSLELLKQQLQQGIKSTLKTNIKKFQNIQEELQKAKKRLQILNNIVKASLVVEGKTQFLKKSKIIKQTYQIKYQSDLRKTNQTILALDNQKKLIFKQFQLKQKNLLSIIEQLQNNNLSLRKHDNQRQQKLQQLSLEILNTNTKLKDIQTIRDKQIQELNKIISIKNKQIQEIKKNIVLKQQQWKIILIRRQKQFQQLQQSTQSKVKQLIASYQKQIDLKNKQIYKKNTQLKEININKTQQQKQLLSQLKLLQFQKNDLLDKITRTTKNHDYQITELNIKIKQLSQENQQKENNLTIIKLQIERLTKFLQQKDNLIHHLNLQIVQFKNTKQELILLKQSFIVRQKQFKQRQILIINDFNQQIEGWKRNFFIKQNQLKIISQTLERFRSRSIIKQLSEIKQLVNNGQTQKMEIELKQITMSYERTNIQFQKKISQNDKLCRQKIQLRQNIIQLQQKIVILQQKINYLNKNIQIYAGQLKQRKQLIQCLIQQKSTLQKQMILLKKSSFENKNVTKTIENIFLISKKIDELLVISTQRQSIIKHTG